MTFPIVREGIEDGIWWFHVRACDGAGNWGPADRFRIKVDTTNPPRPIISSPTHPDEDEWYQDNNPRFEWTTPVDVSGIEGYSYILDNSPSSIPLEIILTTNNSIEFTGLADDTYWFHIRAQDGCGLWGATDHYRVQIGEEPLEPGWISPTDFNDQDNTWDNEPNAYDGSTSTKATCRIDDSGLDEWVWTPWIQLTLPSSIQCEKIRFWAWYSSQRCNRIEVNVYLHDIGDWWEFTGSYGDDQWVEQSLDGTHTVTSAWIRFRVNRYFWSYVVADLHEFQFYQVP